MYYKIKFLLTMHTVIKLCKKFMYKLSNDFFRLQETSKNCRHKYK